MSEANRVLWSEGLFLRTQHFQQQDRFFETVARGTLQAGRLQTFGFRSLTLDPSLLELGKSPCFRRAASSPMARPSPFPKRWTRPSRCPSPPRPGPARCLSRCLSRPPGGVSFDPAHGNPSGARYRGTIVTVKDAIHGGADAEEIEIARPQALLLAPGKSVGGYTALPICETRGLKADGSVALDSTFLPPTLATGAVAWYAQLLQEVITGLDQIADAHGRMVLGGPGAASKTS